VLGPRLRQKVTGVSMKREDLYPRCPINHVAIQHLDQFGMGRRGARPRPRFTTPIPRTTYSVICGFSV